MCGASRNGGLRDGEFAEDAAVEGADLVGHHGVVCDLIYD